jgi:hypothetical protein
MSGQINRNTAAGDFLYNLSLQTDINQIVEIGTWNGLGSTKCIMDAILNKKDKANLITLEADQFMYFNAVNNWNNFSKINKIDIKDKLKLIYGSILNENQLFNLEELKKDSSYINDWENWLIKDIENIKKCPNVLNEIPNNIDLLVLDGGEFSTFQEFNLLEERSKYIFCDDTSVFKCKKIREILINNFNYKILIDAPDQRNGFAAFVKI